MQKNKVLILWCLPSWLFRVILRVIFWNSGILWNAVIIRLKKLRGIVQKQQPLSDYLHLIRLIRENLYIIRLLLL